MTQQELSQIQNRFSIKAQAKIESIQLTSEQKAKKEAIDKEFSAFLLEMKDEREAYNKVCAATIATASEVCKDGNKEVSQKIKDSRKMLVEEYVAAGIAKEHIPFTEQSLTQLDKVATKSISKATGAIDATKDWFERKKEGTLG